MRTILSKSIIALAVLAGAATATEAARESSKAAETKPSPIDPAAMAALDNMGQFLRQQQSFTVHTDTETDYVLASGEKITLASHGDLSVRRPDRLRATVVSDRKQRQFFYDGKTFTIFSPNLGYYAVVAAPPHIIDLAEDLQTKYGLELPLVDLFRWGTAAAGTPEITSARYIGQSMIDGVPVQHYVFRQPGLDWQIWIQCGPQPLPRRLLLTTTDDPTKPQFETEMKWELNTAHSDGEFAFVPPKGSTQITIGVVGASDRENAKLARRSPGTHKQGQAQ